MCLLESYLQNDVPKYIIAITLCYVSRNTKTGQVLEKMVLPSLKEGGYLFKEQANIGEKPNGRAHKVDVLIKDEEKNILLSLKWQQTNGTAEQKVPFEIINLLYAFENHDI